MAYVKDSAAVELGRRGGQKRNRNKGFGSLDSAARKRIAEDAAAARWGKKPPVRVSNDAVGRPQSLDRDFDFGA